MEWALEIVAEWLKDELGTTNKFVGLQLNAYPPPTAPEWYCALDDTGYSNSSDQLKHFVTESYGFQVACWIRVSQTARDRLGALMGAEDLYRVTRVSLGELERKVLKSLLPYEKQYALMARINGLIQTDQSRFGDCLVHPALYVGRSNKEQYTPPWLSDNANIIGFMGRRVSFSFPDRVQTWDSFR